MGHGPARELSQGSTRDLSLSPELSAKLGPALARLDAADARFKGARDEERFAQMSKAWQRLCTEIDGHLRHVAKVLLHHHQFALEVGSEGGSVNAKPFMEENGGALERLYFKLKDGVAVAVVGDRTLSTTTLAEVSYEWVESAVVDWAVIAVENPKKR